MRSKNDWVHLGSVRKYDHNRSIHRSIDVENKKQ